MEILQITYLQMQDGARWGSDVKNSLGLPLLRGDYLDSNFFSDHNFGVSESGTLQVF